MPIRAWFPTQIYDAPLQRGVAPTRALNRELLRACRQVRDVDRAGERWSRENYPGGYTSYGSLCQLHRMSSTFMELARHLRRHVRAFARALEFDLAERELVMTDCWVNIMPPGSTHGLHLHPTSTLSGTYYVRTPRGSSRLKFEDPRLPMFMAAPSRVAECSERNRSFVHYPAEAGRVILFESWLRHAVAASRIRSERVSISFNWNWF